MYTDSKQITTNDQQLNTAVQPLTDNQIWGKDDSQKDFNCPLKVPGDEPRVTSDELVCPEGCNMCEIFELEMEGMQKQNSEFSSK